MDVKDEVSTYASWVCPQEGLSECFDWVQLILPSEGQKTQTASYISPKSDTRIFLHNYERGVEGVSKICFFRKLTASSMNNHTYHVNYFSISKFTQWKTPNWVTDSISDYLTYYKVYFDFIILSILLYVTLFQCLNY